MTTPENAQLTVDWAGLGVPAGAAGVTHFAVSGKKVEIRGISMKDAEKSSPGELSEVLGHELGHALGLDHSDNPLDLMYHQATHHHTAPDCPISQRDAWMLGWLYSQKSTVPMLALNGQKP